MDMAENSAARALVEMYRRPEIARGLKFRGGTALHKLFFLPGGRICGVVVIALRILDTHRSAAVIFDQWKDSDYRDFRRSIIAA
jgi:hypothetical protein